MSALPPRAYLRRGFTLAEMLVTLLIFAIIGLLVGQMISTTANVTVINDKHSDANSQARGVFDRMENDFARMVKRNDVDYIFWKSTGGAGAGANDVMYFYSEAASYFTSSIYSVAPYKTASYAYKNSICLVGYRINNDSTTPSPNCYQMERLGKPLSWDDGPQPVPSATIPPSPVVFLTYPALTVPITDPTMINSSLSTSYSTALFNSTLAGAFSKSGALPGAVGTQTGNFNDCTLANGDSYNPNFYHNIGPQVFRFEYSFQLKDGTESPIPVMAQATASDPNGVPISNISQSVGSPPQTTNDSAGTADGTQYTVGSRWYDWVNHIGYICLDATPNAAIWHEIGLQDITAIVVTIAVMDHQGIVFLNNRGKLNDTVQGMPGLQVALQDGIDSSVAKTWTTALTPVVGTGLSPVASATNLPQSIVSQIRVYQRFFYINNS